MEYKEELDYEEKYGHIPDTKEDILQYIQDNFKINNEKYLAEKKKIESIKWREIKFTIPLVPKASSRPRYSFTAQHFYVPHAAKNKRLIEKYIDYNGIIYTKTQIDITTYLPIPKSSMKAHEILLAEEGLIEPINTPDWDNLSKTYCDMIQGILIINDNIITRGMLEKKFSLKPRIEITLRYQETFDSDFNKKRMSNTKAYKEYFLNEVETYGDLRYE